MTTPQTPGWYPDPDDPNRRRYWNGTGWTTHTEPLKQSWWQMNRNFFIPAAWILVLIAGCGILFNLSGNRSSAPEPQATTQQESEVPLDPADLCDGPVPPEVLKELGKGGIDGNVKLTDGWYERSRDYRQVYFIAAWMPEAKGLDDPVAVFKVNSDPSDPPPGASFKAQAESINEIARDNFVYPFGPDQNAPGGGASMDDDGAEDAYDCANAG